MFKMNVCSIIGSAGQVHLNFEVKYYVENPSQLLDEQTRWLFFLQTWKRVVNGSLPTSPQTCCLLTSYYLQGINGKDEEKFSV